ncbi:lipopolysaccharide biosynthesis protein [Actinomyces bowdenii]|uniref:lipopolysaccharide biosynthesis protein n=1 Tax=Actinomyces bowdenii TaxID=131109 RepID=UPI00312CA198
MTTPRTLPDPPGRREADGPEPARGDPLDHPAGPSPRLDGRAGPQDRQQAHQRRRAWSSVGRTAAAKIVVMGVAGVFGLINTRLIISHFGPDAWAQYGLLASFPGLMPFTDLGIGAVILNTVAGSEDPSRDSAVRRTVVTATRVLVVSALVICTLAVVVGLLGLWPALLGAKLMEGGGATATWCLIIYAMALPLGIGQRIIVGMGRSATQVISQGVVSPAMTCLLLLVVLARLDAGNTISVLSYAANTLVSIICIVVAWRATRPLLREVLRDAPRLRAVPGVPIRGTAGPQLIQSLVIPIAFQTDRLLLSHLGASQSLAQYNLAANLFNLLTQTITVAGVAMWPLFARARARGQVESPIVPSLLFGAGGLVVGLVLAGATPWVARLLSDGRIILPTVLVLAFLGYVVVEAAKQPLGMYMTDPAGLRFQVVPVLVLVPINFAISWILIAPLGPAGPVMGSVISVILCQLLPYSWWVRRDVARRRAEQRREPRGRRGGPDGAAAAGEQGDRGDTGPQVRGRALRQRREDQPDRADQPSGAQQGDTP